MVNREQSFEDDTFGEAKISKPVHTIDDYGREIVVTSEDFWQFSHDAMHTMPQDYDVLDTNHNTSTSELLQNQGDQ